MVVNKAVKINNSPEIIFAKYGNINCFALFIVTNDISTRHTSLIRNYSFELSSLLQIKYLRLILLLKQAVLEQKARNISLFPINFLENS